MSTIFMDNEAMLKSEKNISQKQTLKCKILINKSNSN